MQRLKGKVAIITGGAGGIGSATARRLHQEGARVVIADIDEQNAKKVAAEFGADGLAYACDSANIDSIKAMVEASVRHFGRLDILHNNAALTSKLQQQDTNAPDIPIDIWKLTLDINLTGYLAACKYAIPHMIRAGSGSIVNTASGSGMAGDIVRIGYGVSKAGIIGLTQYVATQHGRQGIRCNAISPGLIVTEAAKSVVPELLDIISNHVLTNRLGIPEDIAALVAFLCSDEAGYITGQNICVDGGSLSHQPHLADVIKFMQAAH